MQEKITIKKIGTPAESALASGIRYTVFVEEQHCPADLERQHDELSVHFLGSLDDQPCGAARWRRTEKGYKLERIAVLPTARGRGVGSALVQALLADLPADHLPRYLNSQLEAIPVYEKHGFVPVGETFVEAGIQHRQMILQL